MSTEKPVKEKVKIVIIGAGSATFSACIVRDLCITKGLEGSHVTFMDIDERKLDMVASIAARLAAELGTDFEFSKTTDREAALDGADFVINTAQVGGHAYAEACRNLGTAHGYYRGTWLHYLRQMVFFREVTDDIARICPVAVQIQSANPVFEGCTLLARTVPAVKTIGLCHGHYGIRNIARSIGLDPARADGRAVGFNHWIWLSEFRYEGQDAMPLLKKWIDDHEGETGLNEKYDLGAAAIEQYRSFGLLPVGDTARMAAWWMHVDYETKQKWFGEQGGMDSHVKWQKYLEGLDKKNDNMEKIASDPSAKVSDTFKPVPSGEQIVPIINSYVNNVKNIYQVNIPNEGHIIKGIPENVVVECQAMIDSFGIHPISEKPFPDNLMIKAILPRWSFAELMVEAVRQRDAGLLLHHILNDHRTRTYDQAKDYIDAWLNMEGNNQMKEYFGRQVGIWQA